MGVGVDPVHGENPRITRERVLGSWDLTVKDTTRGLSVKNLMEIQDLQDGY